MDIGKRGRQMTLALKMATLSIFIGGVFMQVYVEQIK